MKHRTYYAYVCTFFYSGSPVPILERDWNGNWNRESRTGKFDQNVMDGMTCEKTPPTRLGFDFIVHPRQIRKMWNNWYPRPKRMGSITRDSFDMVYKEWRMLRNLDVCPC